jgi:hypothetical protein
MSIQITTWRPDTCGCVIDFMWDDAVTPDQRTFTGTTTRTHCSAHAHLRDATTHFDTLQEENPRKNKALAHVQEHFGLTEEQMREVSWTFDHERVLNIALPDHASAQAKAVQQLCDQHLGAGRVVVK